MYYANANCLVDVLPDALVQHILSSLKNAKDIASCSCVCRRWREIMTQIPSLHFPRTIGDEKGCMGCQLGPFLPRDERVGFTFEYTELVVGRLFSSP